MLTNERFHEIDEMIVNYSGQARTDEQMTEELGITRDEWEEYSVWLEEAVNKAEKSDCAQVVRVVLWKNRIKKSSQN